MRKIDGSSNYLSSQIRKYLSKAILSLLFSILLLTLTAYIIIFKTHVISIIEAALLIAALILLIPFRYCQYKYQIYKSGRQGEKTVIRTLTSKLNDEYYLMNGVYLKSGGGDIDHIVLGPTGIYVLETKNWSGKIICNDTQWQRPGKKITTNPSLQAKNNAQKIKRALDSSLFLRGHNIYVEGLIVFTNTHAKLSISNSIVPVLRIQQLSDYIKNQKSNSLTREQIQQIIKQIQIS
ncbi:MAG: NERD domain-containing protein [Candidatus Bathyarchaeota archaeon]|nr:NERD domain-containing protein [Candidatus Termiticorpusculum sp.]MCL1971344.1 NERD domain-containing protein [Candidatus Termiticorpusculum sp.]